MISNLYAVDSHWYFSNCFNFTKPSDYKLRFSSDTVHRSLSLEQSFSQFLFTFLMLQQPSLNVVVLATGVVSNLAARQNDAVARDDDHDTVVSHCLTDRTACLWWTSAHRSKLCVCDYLSERNVLCQRLPDTIRKRIAWLLKVAYWWQLQVADTVCGLMEIFLEPLSTFCSYIVATANCIGLMCIPDYNIDTWIRREGALRWRNQYSERMQCLSTAG